MLRQGQCLDKGGVRFDIREDGVVRSRGDVHVNIARAKMNHYRLVESMNEKLHAPKSTENATLGTF